MSSSIGFIGAGNMGGAIIRGILNDRTAGDRTIIVSDPREEALASLKSEYPAITTDTDNSAAAGADICILAVKPQVYKPVIESIRDLIPSDTRIVTIAAGITMETVGGWFDRDMKIIRTMPNTPALVGEGMTALCPGTGVNDEELNEVRDIFEMVGKTVTLPEKMMDAYTALAGSSPAWVFMFLEALADGAVREGLPRAEAYTIASQAVLGSAKLAAESGLHPGILKDQVCSPGGTTIEAVATLEQAGFRSAVIQAVSDCSAKAAELGKK